MNGDNVGKHPIILIFLLHIGEEMCDTLQIANLGPGCISHVSPECYKAGSLSYRGVFRVNPTTLVHFLSG